MNIEPVTTRCLPCYGSGKLLGGGMITKDCYHCFGKGNIDVVPEENEIEFLSMQQSDAYKSSVKRIADQANVSEEEARKLLEKEFNGEVPKKRGRKKKEAA